MAKITDPELIKMLDSLEAQSAEPRSTTSIGALGAGAAQGLTFGTSDEIIAGAGAAYDYLTGGGDFGPSYDRRVAEQRDYLKRAAEQNPVAYYGGEIAGAVALPGGLAARGIVRGAQAGAGLARQTVRGAAEGAAYGAAYGAGKSEGGIQNRMLGGVEGGTTGFVFGAAAPAVISGITRGAGAVGNRIMDAVSPERAATRMVGEAVENARTRGGAQPNMPPGVDDPRMLVDVSEETRALGRRAANLSPEARATLNEPINRRFETQADRLMGFLRGSSRSPGNATQYRERLLQRQRQENRRGYRASYAQGDQPIRTEAIDELMDAPMFVAAMRGAVQNGKNRAVLDGFRAFNPGARVTDDGRIVFTRGENGVPQYPNLQYWDYVKRELDEMASKAFRQGANQEGAQAAEMANRLRSSLDDVVPSYQATRGRAAEFFQAGDALEAGENFARRSGDYAINDLRDVIRQMTPSEREAFREGFLSRTLQEIRANPDRRTIVNKYMHSPAARERMELALGDDAANRLQNLMGVETIMDITRNQLQGNSTTARQLMEYAGAGGVGALLSGGNIYSPEFWISALATRAGQRIRGAQQERWARQIAQLLTSARNGRQLERHLQRFSRNRQLSDAFQTAIRNMAGPGAGLAAGERAAVEGGETP